MNRTRASRARRLAAAGVLVAIVVGSSLAADEDRPLREGDVVGMLVRGASTESILEAIRSRPARFDLSAEIQQELRLAGVPEAVIQAMLARKAELEPRIEAEPFSANEDETTDPGLRILLNPDRKEETPAVLLLQGTIDPGIRQALQLGASAEGEAFQDLAVYVACLVATHVPDHWRSKSPLGRDFVSMPRHRMLAFVSAAETSESVQDGVIRFELPERLELDLAPGEGHDLLLGVAVQADGRYFRLVDDVWDELTIGDGASELRAEIEGGQEGRIGSIAVRFDRTAPEDRGF